ncbi:MAG: hypothetical protein NUW22_12355 [Acidobacteria bacterium]|nr:hypothetical protein [Acidobacteriota bacterium]
MRNISFALTTEQIRTQAKTVTRRMGWKDLKPGTLLQPVVKGMGLKKGESVEKIGGPVRVLSVSRQQLRDITPQDVYREGFPQMTREEFIWFFMKSHTGCYVDSPVTRIEFEYTGACAHLRVSWRTAEIECGLTTGWWECDSGCGMRFSTIGHVADLLAAAEVGERMQTLARQWTGMIELADAEPAIVGDEIGHASRWEAVRMCLDEVLALLPADGHAT